MLRCRNIMLSLLATVLYANYAYAQYQANMFLNGQYKNGVKSQPQQTVYAVNPAANIFLEHAIISRQASPFNGPTYLPPKEFVKCASGQQCVRKSQCQSGYFTQQLPKIQNCEQETDICCIYRPPPPPPTTTTQKPFISCGRDSDCVSPNDCRNGEIIDVNYVKKQTPNRCYSPEVCCRLPSTTLTNDGYVLNVPTKKFPLPTTTYRPLTSPTKPNNEYLPPTQPPYRPQQTQPPYRPQPQPQPTQPAYRPQPTQPQPTQPAYRPQPTQPAYRPQPTQPAYRPQPTQPAYRPQPTQPAYRPQPTQPAYRPNKPTNEYLPPLTNNDIDRIPAPSNVKPNRGEDQLSPQIFPTPKFNDNFPKHYAKCASALVCTTENYCSANGIISESPVNLTPIQAAYRVPLTDCLIEDSGAPGKCCRDPNYVDPWPINMGNVCGKINTDTKPTGIKNLDTNFAEIPWQAMVLKDSSKTLLCGGAIVGPEFVLTTASCVQGVSANDVRVKAGEWELGSTTEPLPFQLLGVRGIDTHPSYNPSTGANDLAMIRLEKPLNFATHIKPICVSDEDPSSSETCITTGWGQQALRLHEEGAIMHKTSTTTQDRGSCGADATGVCSATKFDACEFDSGSALACGNGPYVLLKGIFSKENGCGEGQSVRFSKPDIAWINKFQNVSNNKRKRSTKF